MLLTIIPLCLLISLISIGITTPSSDTSPSEIYIGELTVNSNKITISGDFIASGKSFRGYKYYIKDNNIYLKIKGGLITKKYSDGHFNIVINENTTNINNIYLQFNNKNSLLH